MNKTNFRDWTIDELEKTFTLTQIWTLSTLTLWIDSSVNLEINEYEFYLLKQWRQKLIYRGDSWNEIELIEHFIAPILALVDFNTEKFGLFMERSLKAVIDEYELVGEPDAMIATGRRLPEIPYFCFHEYKKENEPKGDPLGQTLAAMLASQSLNKNGNPIYGLYVTGERWRFIVLEGKEYSISLPYSSVKDELFEIFRLLKCLKQIIEKLVEE
ncbi:MAG: hypothetical protein H7A23_24400 [Leptospiraceae bacterium]|nr:hypothetical protein [Leptospiraceae bacterium]MCP5497707.1 hypothetical protein [Leptospiraceae bacterium]